MERWFCQSGDYTGGRSIGQILSWGCGNGMHPDEVFDDLYVRAVYLDDNTATWSTVFCVIDCIGLSNHDVLRIRRKVAEYNPVLP
jgi:hypothetical protein